MIHELNRSASPTGGDSIRVVGIGGAGSAILDRIATSWLKGPSAIVVDTAADVIEKTSAPTKLQIGRAVAKGLGVGGDVTIGASAAEEDIDLVRGMFEGVSLAFLVVGMGGGVGTGAAPVVAKAARDAGTVTICLATMPFAFEGSDCVARAEHGLEAVMDVADIVIVVPNERVAADADDTTLAEAFRKVDEVVSAGIYAVWKLLSEQGMINLDFADLRNLVQNSDGACSLGFGESRSKKNRASAAVSAALGCSMLGKRGVAGAEALLVGLIGGPDMTLRDIDSVMSEVGGATRQRARVFMGAVTDEEMVGKLLVTIMTSDRWRPASVGGDDEMTLPLAGTRTGRRAQAKATQVDLELMTAPGKGRFKDIEPTILDGEDLDVPTYVRRGIAIEK